MLPEIRNYGQEVTLIMNSGIQFLDFALKIDWKDNKWRSKVNGCFIDPSESGALVRLIEDIDSGKFFAPDNLSFAVTPTQEISVDQSLKLFDGIWLPVPVLRSMPPERFDKGPHNWSRVRIVSIPEGEDADGNTHRITFAFDTKIFSNMQDVAYLAPTENDVKTGAVFSLAHRSDQVAWYLEQKWITSWLIDLFQELAPQPERLKIHKDDIELEINNKAYYGHYLNILNLLADSLQLPKIKIVSNNRDDVVKSIPVDMILDVGNSRTCGILIEDHVQDKDSLNRRYELEIRDLTQPEHIYNEPFESRVEFAQTFFGKEHFSLQSGRRDTFRWPSIVRVGKEASRLASRREGNEGATGLSSPKRYLWDQEKYEQGWRFNSHYVKSDHEPFATAEPFSSLINEYGEALHVLSNEIEEEFDRKMPVFHPKYSRSSLMTFMLCEVLMHALMQINSVAQRNKLEHARTPRNLRSIILTIPPAMPKPEQAIFKSCVYQAIGLVWKSLGWDSSDDDIDFSDPEQLKSIWPNIPEIYIQWDEATCGQVVYLFNETQNNYNGRSEEFIASMVRPDKTNKQKLTIATVDIGGGTTDLVINDYELDYGANKQLSGSNAYIVPTQRFRDGFKVAGDDILLDIIQDTVLSSLNNGLKQAGLADPNPILSTIIGSQQVSIQDAVLRQQLTLQLFTPVGLHVLKLYELYDPLHAEQHVYNMTFSELLQNNAMTDHVLNFINEPISRALNNPEFSVLDLNVEIDLKRIHHLFIRGDYYNICKTFDALSEIISCYQCDVLLLTGRPSRLPGVQSYFRSRLSMPVGRILPLHGYYTGGWYPFHKQERIDDPKTTAAVGAMLCFLSKNLRLPNFYFRSSNMDLYSTVKYIGLLDNLNMIKKENIYYQDIDLDDPDYDFPDHSFEIRGTTRLGFKQLEIDRWPASPIYILTIENSDVAKRLSAEGVVLEVTLGIKNRQKTVENFYIKDVKASDGRACNKTKDIKLNLNTMVNSGLISTQYWLDSGMIKR
ncbi:MULTISPECIES: virulence factor SrfB [unclassified Gilliamella]|uniref:virulence factor SrfB n=1 Tax=unclassified Gilliamella TaxID=2685620 RepID=UPI00080E8B2D|nr:MULTISPECIES: virulence factor SrfB [Gilliamella]MCX8581738.1 virulence factor SrfB [Gilliamella sp. B3482]MCX8584349.1 virulence factor SrfB [Gilliamella sp. B3372]MCX8585751.1 virulence factor SrfB [Gilliamella sp. B3562]MCX8595184.1 virulence factor SrfB [Gilliamella sp. B3367]MCX8661032.1 virulence factor SrfB [Gilliamella sp. B2772]